MSKIGTNVIRKWTKSVGGYVPATKIIMDKLGCSESKAEKIAGGRYPSLPTPLEQKALAELIGCPRETLFPLRKRAA